MPPLPLPRIDEADVALATLLMAAARHERTTQQRKEKGERWGRRGKEGTTERHTDPVRGEHVLVVNRKHCRGRATQAKRTCRVLSLCPSLSLAYAHTHTETFLSMLQMSKWQKPGNSKDSDAHTARTPTRREVYTSCRPAQQIVLSLPLSLSLGRDSLSRASLFSCSFSLKVALSISVRSA